MSQLYATISTGTAATLLAAILVLLRARFKGRRPFVEFARRWIAASSRSTGPVLGLLAAIAMVCFANIPAIEGIVHANAPFEQVMVSGAPATPELESLRTYLDENNSKRQSTSATTTTPTPVELPDVNTMITKLFARLEKQPNDVSGWKLLGWSYLNTDRPEEAVRAYETALKLDPGDLEIKKALDQAKSAQNAAVRTPP